MKNLTFLVQILSLIIFCNQFSFGQCPGNVSIPSGCPTAVDIILDAQNLPPGNATCANPTDAGCATFTFNNIPLSTDPLCPAQICFTASQGCGIAPGDICLYAHDGMGGCIFLGVGGNVSETCIIVNTTSFSVTTCRSGIGPVSLNNISVGPCAPPCSITASASATDESCAGNNDGTITVNAMATGCAGTLEYSLNGGAFQASNVFMGVAPGAHTVVVRCSTDPSCTATATATVNPGASVSSATATPTHETCVGGNDGTITVSATAMNCAGTLEYSLNGGAFQASNVFTGVPPGMHTVTVRCSTSPTCTTNAMATVNAAAAGSCPTASQTSANDPTSFDPCSCGDPQNYYDGNGDITYFHDFVEVTSMTGETWEVTAVSAQAYSDDGMTNIMVGDVLTETMPGSGIYRIDLFHPPGVGFTMTVDRTAGGGPFPLMEGGTCVGCKQVPTLGQWGLILLSLLILTFGVVALRKREPVLAGYETTSPSDNKFTLPFDKASFGKMLITVMMGLAVVFAVAVAAFGYEMTEADVPGSLVAGPMLAYLMHLLIPKKD